jgi:SsrA-binding protein
MIEKDEVIVTNHKARRDYFIEESFEAGIELKGCEVKSLRDKRGNLNDGFARIFNGEVFLYNLHISPYPYSKIEPPDPLRTRKLLLHKHQIKKLVGELSTSGRTLIPLKLYFKKGKVKVEVGLAKGKRQYDKRETIKRREQDKEARRAMKHR